MESSNSFFGQELIQRVDNLTLNYKAKNVQTNGSETFSLTEAVKPYNKSNFLPKNAYRHDYYINKETGYEIPVLWACATKEILFELFLDLLKPLGESVDIILESSHTKKSFEAHNDIFGECIDMPVLQSHLWDFEDFLLNDGCSGIAVRNDDLNLEVQFDEHKHFIIFADNLEPFIKILHEHGIFCEDNMIFIFETPHIHFSKGSYLDSFRELVSRFSLDFEV